MEQINFDAKSARLIRVCKKSVVVEINDKQYFILGRVWNKLAQSPDTPVFVQESDDGRKWLAIPSRF